MDLLHTYNDMAGRICSMWRDYSHPVRPYVLTVEAGGRKRCATYPTQAAAEHAAAHFMATGDLPAAAEGSGVASPKPEIHKNAPKTALPPQGGASTRGAAETRFATGLQRQGGAN